ncbi:MAG: ATP-binding protein [Terracidiphilus sp.]|jgi:serine/threonine-protein kinase RsbW
MPGETAAQSEPHLTIESRLEDLALLWPWAESIADIHGLPAATRFAIHLCLEEAISNVIRHGYRGELGRPVTVQFASQPDELVFTVEDEAPAFDPLDESREDQAPDASATDQIPLGGQGIRLLRKFAGSLVYQGLPTGNRLTMRFPIQR